MTNDYESNASDTTTPTRVFALIYDRERLASLLNQSE